MLNYKSQVKEWAPKIGAKQVRFPSLDESNRQKYLGLSNYHDSKKKHVKSL